MAKTIRSYNLINTLVELMNEGYTGRVTFMQNPSSAGIIILMNAGQIYRITGSEREGLAALTQLVKWQSGIVKLESVQDESVFKDSEPMKIGGVLKYIIEQERLRRDDLAPILFATTAEYLMQGPHITIKREEARPLSNVLEEAEANHTRPLIIYMAAPEEKILILMGEDSSVVIGNREKLSLEYASKVSILYRFSYFIYPITEPARKKLLEGLIEFMKTDVVQNEVLDHLPNPRVIKEVIQSNNMVIFYRREDNRLKTLPCVREECFRELNDFKKFFKKEVKYVAW